MLGCAIVFILAGLVGSSAPALVLGIVMMIIHLDRLNRKPAGNDRADGPWDGDIDDDDAI